MPGARLLQSPSVARNREPLLTVLRGILPLSGSLIELACGSGEHAVHFAPRFPGLAWTPTDVAESALMSANAWRAQEPSANLHPARLFDAWLKGRDPASGVRDLAAMKAEGSRVGLTMGAPIPMPANNLVLVFRR